MLAGFGYRVKKIRLVPFVCAHCACSRPLMLALSVCVARALFHHWLTKRNDLEMPCDRKGHTRRTYRVHRENTHPNRRIKEEAVGKIVICYALCVVRVYIWWVCAVWRYQQQQQQRRQRRRRQRQQQQQQSSGNDFVNHVCEWKWAHKICIHILVGGAHKCA